MSYYNCRTKGSKPVSGRCSKVRNFSCTERRNSIPTEIGETEINDDEGRERVERRVVDLIVAKDKRFKSNFANISDAVIGAKRMALSDNEPERIAEFIGLKTR